MTFMSLFVACTDDDDDASGTDSGFTEEVVVVNPACDDYTYQLKTDKQWKAEIADQWASLYVASGKGSSELKFFTEENGITFEVPDQTTVIVKGISKQSVGQIAAQIREKRPPEPYLGKGIKYSGEYIRRKAGKTGK